MRILFMGTPEFAVPSLERIIKDGHELCGVITQPDRPRGRGLAICPPPVKIAAEKYGVSVFQPQSLKGVSVDAYIRDLSPELIVVVAYGRILPESVLNIPPLGCVNVHASLLPAYRGAAPIQWAIINGEKRTGITTMHMAKGLDTGDIILMEALNIGENETFGELHDEMMELGACVLSSTLTLIAKNEAPRKPQGDTGVSYAPLIDNSVATVDFRKPARQIYNLVRALSPNSGAMAILNGMPVKIYEAVLSDEPVSCAPGTILEADGGIGVSCGDGRQIIITQIQQKCCKKMTAPDYLRGHKAAASGRFHC